MSTGLRTYVVYRNPKDHPGKFVVRGWLSLAGRVVPDQHCAVADTIDAARRTIPAGLVPMLPMPGDDACIVETWL